MLKYLKNLFTSILIWRKPVKIGHVNFDVQESTLRQDIMTDQQLLEVDLEEWKDMTKDIFSTDNFVTEGFQRPVQPNNEILKQQIQLFWKDYRKFNQKVDQIYTKTAKHVGYDNIDFT